MDANTARRWVPLAVVGGLLVLVAVAASVATPGIHRVPILHDSETPPPASAHPSVTVNFTPGPSRSPSAIIQLPAWLSPVADVLCSVFGLALVGFLLWHLVRIVLQRRAARLMAADNEDLPVVTRRAAVLAAVDAGIAELASEGGDPRAAVIACWVRLEEVAAAAGTPREPGDTPTDLVTRLLGAHQVSPAVLSSLAELYRAARYGVAAIDSEMRMRARAALGHLRGELARSRSGTLEHDAVVEVAMATGAVPRPAVPRPARRPGPAGSPEGHR